MCNFKFPTSPAFKRVERNVSFSDKVDNTFNPKYAKYYFKMYSIQNNVVVHVFFYKYYKSSGYFTL
jgi:hypothetical protein